MKHYLIDSENVGDFWIPLLELPADEAELIVFYTKNSPHMSYDSLIKLKESDRTVTFIKCYEGTNALDFQLCSELGYLIACNEGDEFIVVTNDTGYDAAVKYWRRKEYSVKRIAGKDSRTGGRRRGTPVRFDVAAEVSAILHKLVKIPENDGAQEPSCAEEEKKQTPAHSLYFAEPEEDLEEAASEEEMDFAQEESSDDYDEDESEVTEEEKEFSEEEISEEEVSEEEIPEEIAEEDISEDEAEDLSEEEEESFGSEAEEEGSFGSEAEEESAESFEENAEETDDQWANDKEETENGLTDDENREKAEDEEAEDIDSGSASEQPAQETASLEENSQESAGEETQSAQVKGIPAEIDPEEITAIVNCIGMENLAELHNQLIQFYGDEGKDIYQSIKSGTLTIEKKDWDKEEKFLYYCAMIFRHSDEPAQSLTEETISEFASFLLSAENKRKNLNSLRYALLKHYGKEKGRRYYFMLKPYVKALNQM